MKDLIEALLFIQQFMKEPNNKYPTACEHDDFYVCGVDLEKMSFEDVKRLLNKFDFIPGADEDWHLFTNLFGEDFNMDEMTQEQWVSIRGALSDCVHSFRFGSC